MERECIFCGRELKFYEGALGYEALRCDYCKIDYTENSISMQDKGSWKLIEEHLGEKIEDGITDAVKEEQELDERD